MTTTTTKDPLAEFRRHLPARVNRQLRDTARAAVLVHRATFEQGWSTKALVSECMRNHNGAVNAAGLIMHRLDWCADNPPPETAKAVANSLCGHCDNGWVYADPADPRSATRCTCRTTPAERKHA